MTPAVRKLEHSHRFCLKHMQGLPRRTPTHFTLSVMSFSWNTNTFLDNCVFNIRLTHFKHLENQSLSFIPDIYRILIKYALHHVLDRYLLDGVFPSKCAWKRIIDQKTIQRSNTELFHECVESFPTCAPSILRSDGVSCICTMTSYCKELSSI